MQTLANFQHGDIVGQVRRPNAALDEFDKAVLTNALYAQYPGVREALRDVMVVDEHNNVSVDPKAVADVVGMGALTIFNRINEFVDVALRVVQISGAPWNIRSAPNDTFRSWLADEGLRTAIRAAIEELDNPNGPIVGKATPEQAQSPLPEPPSESSASS